MNISKKTGFTLAETIMVLFITGVVVVAAMPVFTMRNNNAPMNDNHWDLGNDTLKSTLKSTHQFTIKTQNTDTAMTFKTAEDGETFSYDLTVNDAVRHSPYEIFRSDRRNIRIGDFYFYEDVFRNLYITKNNYTTTTTTPPNGSENNVVIGDHAIGDNNTNNVYIGGNRINAGASIDVPNQENVVIGHNNTVNGSFSTVFGRGNADVGNNAVVIGNANGVSLNHGGDDLQIGDYITAEDSTVTFNRDVDIAGTIQATSFISSSDERLKNIKGAYHKGLKEILRIKPVIFQYKADKTGGLHVGVIAQDIQKIFPEAVVNMHNGFLGVNKDPLFFASLNALKEINNQRNIELERQQKLQIELLQLEKDLKKLEPSIWQKFYSKIIAIFKGGKHA